jgi:murein DD-endopeptidase / murein LD-carboxypeptidase
LQAVGTPFRLYGRKTGVALDCVGLVLHAINLPHFVANYGLKGDYLELLRSIANQNGFMSLAVACHNGDIAMAECGSRQQHLMVRASNGWVHAHAGLRRVVHTPGPSPWPIIAVWRSPGDMKWQRLS